MLFATSGQLFTRLILNRGASLLVVFLFLLGNTGVNCSALADEVSPKETADDKDSEKPREIRLAKGELSLSVPAYWEVKKPAISMIEAEFSVPKRESAEEDGNDEKDGEDKKDRKQVAADEKIPSGRLTMMQSGGSVAQNIERWKGQFTEAKSQEKNLRVAELDVKLVDISGTYLDRPAGGPFAQGKPIPRPEYRMLGAIVATRGKGQYFFKLYGPAAVIADAEPAFLNMIESIREGETVGKGAE